MTSKECCILQLHNVMCDFLGPGALLALRETFTAHSQILRFRVVCCKFTCTGTTFCFDYLSITKTMACNALIPVLLLFSLYSVIKIDVEIDIKKCIYQLCSKPNLFRL